MRNLPAPMSAATVSVALLLALHACATSATDINMDDPAILYSPCVASRARAATAAGQLAPRELSAN